MIDAAILLAAGLGTRLAPLTQVRAKAALPVAGEVLIRRQLRWLAAAGVRRVLVNLHHLPATITGRVGHGDDLGMEIRYSWEPVVLGSGGGPRRAFDLLDAERALIINGDTLTDLDLAAIVATHERHGALVTMATTPDARPGYNALVLDHDDRLLGVARRRDVPRPEWAGQRHVHFIGVQVAERRAFATVSAETPSEVLTGAYPALLAADASAVRVHAAAVAFHDIGTPAEYLSTVQKLAASAGRALDCGRDAEVHASADVHDSVLWDGVAVGAGAVVHRCVLADGVHVPEGVHLSNAAVIRHADARAGLPGAPLGDLWVTPIGAAA